MSPFTKISLANTGDAKALFFAILATLLFIAFLNVVLPRSVRKGKAPSVNHLDVPIPAAPNKLQEWKSPASAELEGRFRVVPEHFKNVDFANHSYVIHNTPDLPIEFTLHNRELRLQDQSGWFDLQDVLYNDVTGDGKAEAIVRLSHVKCAGGFCDGGADLYYIYSMRNGKLTTLWRYQTGTRANGCSSKSLMVAEKQLVLESFGMCSEQGASYPGPAKFVVNHLTFMLFEFDGRRFVRKTTEFVITASPANVKNYEPVLRVF